MTTAQNDLFSTSAPAAWSDDTAVTDVTALLPTRDAVLARLVDQMPEADVRPLTLMVIGLLRRDDGWPTPRTTLADVTTLLARSLRGDDWLGSAGPAEFVVLLSGTETAARSAADRLVAAIGDLGVPGLAAAAGTAGLSGDLSGREVFRRANLSLTAARRVGPGTVISYREPS